MPAGTDIDWYAIQTRTGAEEVASQTLGTLGLETFLPRARVVAPRKCRPARAVRPLFPGYCFARFQPQLHLHSVRYSRGVLRVVGAGSTPWPVEESIIADLRARLDETGVVELQSTRFRPGDRVRLIAGPLEGWTGIFDSELDDCSRVVILLHAIQQARVVAQRDWLELAEAV